MAHITITEPQINHIKEVTYFQNKMAFYGLYVSSETPYMSEEMKKENNGNEHLTNEEILKIIGLSKKPGMRFTVDLYLLDYIKHCFLEENQLNLNIQKLQTALAFLDKSDAKKGVEDVIRSLQCVQDEYGEYLEDTRILADGGYPGPRGAGQSAEA